MDKDEIQHKEIAAGRWAEMPLAGELIQRDFDMFMPGAKKTIPSEFEKKHP
ncbi:MAG: hypothetical protein J6W54_14355 [Fibrobacter sp.]|uniref:hypothetical protein n=1 Tax=Fibrobacter sp. TaxID=35828 RepID=UPI001B1C6FC8|nr:hypothetical protein [Fibrobacter sp.]MBO7062253.1 hypothetical protein [Fibrobacter sp.]